MSNVIIIETDDSKETVINQISVLTGNSELELTAPFSGSVRGNTFRMNRFDLFTHPFVPVATGCVRDIEQHSVVELTFVSPWLGHAAMCTVLAVYSGMIWPLSLDDGVGVAAIGFIWGLLLMLREKGKKDFIKIFKSKLNRSVK